MCFFKRKPKEENLLFDVPKAEIMDYFHSLFIKEDKNIKINITEDTESLLCFDITLNLVGVQKDSHAEYRLELFEEGNQTRVEVEVTGTYSENIRKDIVKKLNKKFNPKK